MSGCKLRVCWAPSPESTEVVAVTEKAPPQGVGEVRGWRLAPLKRGSNKEVPVECVLGLQLLPR